MLPLLPMFSLSSIECVFRLLHSFIHVNFK